MAFCFHVLVVVRLFAVSVMRPQNPHVPGAAAEV